MIPEKSTGLWDFNSLCLNDQRLELEAFQVLKWHLELLCQGSSRFYKGTDTLVGLNPCQQPGLTECNRQATNPDISSKSQNKQKSRDAQLNLATDRTN